jgi:3-hydroxyisobutyrate dehydrogenase-like beta-hydroxyacid dehydrogenase
MKIGWIGLGGIGVEMVKRLRAADFPVTVYTRGKGLDEAKAAGAATCDSYTALAAQSELLCLCVFNDIQLRDVMFNEGVLAALPPGAIVANHTTGSPEVNREIGARAPEGVEVLDATFSGGPMDVKTGGLTIMSGGAPEALERAKPALGTYASRIFHTGPLGSGQTIKLLNNLSFAANIMNAAEILRLADKQGLKIQAVAEMIQASSGASYAMNVFKASPAPSFALTGARHYMEKDVAAAMAAAQDSGLDVSHFQIVADYFKPVAKS